MKDFAQRYISSIFGIQMSIVQFSNPSIAVSLSGHKWGLPIYNSFTESSADVGLCTAIPAVMLTLTSNQSRCVFTKFYYFTDQFVLEKFEMCVTVSVCGCFISPEG